jgi:hypothetical protein
MTIAKPAVIAKRREEKRKEREEKRREETRSLVELYAML